MEIRLEVNLTILTPEDYPKPEDIARLVSFLLRIDSTARQAIKVDSVKVIN